MKRILMTLLCAVTALAMGTGALAAGLPQLIPARMPEPADYFGEGTLFDGNYDYEGTPYAVWLYPLENGEWAAQLERYVDACASQPGGRSDTAQIEGYAAVVTGNDAGQAIVIGDYQGWNMVMVRVEAAEAEPEIVIGDEPGAAEAVPETGVGEEPGAAEAEPEIVIPAEPGAEGEGGHYEGQWVAETVSCPICNGTGRCTICNGTGTYTLYGQTLDCDPYCAACAGAGSYTRRDYRQVWVEDAAAAEPSAEVAGPDAEIAEPEAEIAEPAADAAVQSATIRYRGTEYAARYVSASYSEVIKKYMLFMLLDKCPVSELVLWIPVDVKPGDHWHVVKADGYFTGVTTADAVDFSVDDDEVVYGSRFSYYRHLVGSDDDFFDLVIDSVEETAEGRVAEGAFSASFAYGQLDFGDCRFRVVLN